VSVSLTTRALRDERGLSLVELLVVMPMLTILLGGLTLTIVNLVHWNDQTREQTAQLGDARSAIRMFVSEVRQAYPVDPGTGVQLPIVTATSSAITFYAPDRLPTSGTNGFHLRKIAYDFTTNQLRRQSTTSAAQYQVGGTVPPNWNFPVGFPTSTAWIPLVGPPNGADTTGSFTYYDSSGATLTAPVASIGTIASVGITLNTTSGRAPARITTYTGRATLRENQS
jgi:type II secretory pathway pseudopilin PulG